MHGACRILVPSPEIELAPSAVKARSLNHWPAREVLQIHFRNNFSISVPQRLRLDYHLMKSLCQFVKILLSNGMLSHPVQECGNVSLM